MEFTTQKVEWLWAVGNESIGRKAQRDLRLDDILVCAGMGTEQVPFSRLGLSLFERHLATEFIVFWNPFADRGKFCELSKMLTTENPDAHVVGVQGDLNRPTGKRLTTPERVKCELVSGSDLQAAAAAVAIAHWNGTLSDCVRHFIFMNDELFRYEVQHDHGTWAARIANTEWL